MPSRLNGFIPQPPRTIFTLVLLVLAGWPPVAMADICRGHGSIAFNDDGSAAFTITGSLPSWASLPASVKLALCQVKKKGRWTAPAWSPLPPPTATYWLESSRGIWTQMAAARRRSAGATRSRSAMARWWKATAAFFIIARPEPTFA